MVKLPSLGPPDPFGMPPPRHSLAPGEPPSAAFPAGTVYVARAQHDSSIAEWDLARGTVRRHRLLDPLDHINFRIRRIGNTLHVLSYVYNGDIQHLQLNLELKHPSPVIPLGQVGAGGPDMIAGDDEWSLVLMSVIPLGYSKYTYGYFAFSFDATGRPIVRGKLPGQDLGGRARTVVFIADRAFVPMESTDEFTLLLRLDRALNIERIVPLHAPSPHNSSFEGLLLWNEQVLAKWYSGPLLSRFSASGDSLSPVAACNFQDPVPGEDRDIWLSGEHVTLTGDDHDNDEWLEWTDPGVEPLPLPACLGAP
jgi:hypothetical protein